MDYIQFPEDINAKYIDNNKNNKENEEEFIKQKCFSLRKKITKKIRTSNLEKGDEIQIWREFIMGEDEEDQTRIIKCYNIICDELIKRNYKCEVSFGYMGISNNLSDIILYLSIP